MTDQPSKDEILNAMPSREEIQEAITAGLFNAMPYQSQILAAIFGGTDQALKDAS